MNRSRFSMRLKRRLCVEAMENRWTMSATPLSIDSFNPAPIDFEVIPFSLDLKTSMSGQTVWLTTLGEGGFISFDTSNNHFLDTSAIPGSIVFNGVPRDAGNLGSILTPVTNGTPQWNASDVTTSGIRPILIVLPESPWEAKGVGAPVWNDPLVTESDPALGGSISIETILAPEEPELAPKSTFAASLAATSLPDTALPEIADDSVVLSGEWTRAIVFETSGGEPQAMVRPLRKESSTLEPSPDSAALPRTDASSQIQHDPARAIANRSSGSRSNSDAVSADYESARIPQASTAELPVASVALPNRQSDPITPSVIDQLGNFLNLDLNISPITMPDSDQAENTTQSKQDEEVEVAILFDEHAAWPEVFDSRFALVAFALVQFAASNSSRQISSARDTWPFNRPQSKGTQTLG